MDNREIKDAVRERYAGIAKKGESCCPSCGTATDSMLRALAVGYSQSELKDVPESAIMGLGCGNPTALASLAPGETVVDLGSGAGIDVFLAAGKVGPTGRVIGVDMTEEMVGKANAMARGHGFANVEFRLGEIENLPVESASVDTVISNCVINLAPDKSKVFAEVHRALKPGGRMVVSDIVTETPLSPEMRADLNGWAECLSGALEKNDYLAKIVGAGFTDVETKVTREFYRQACENGAMVKFLSMTIKAARPAG